MVSHSVLESPIVESAGVGYGYKDDSPDTSRAWFGWFHLAFECECSVTLQDGRLQYLRGES